MHKTFEREGPTRQELEAFAATLPPDQAATLLAGAVEITPDIDAAWKNVEGREVPVPVYESWDAYLAATSDRERRQWCVRKAKKANRSRLMSGEPDGKIRGEDVWRVLESAQGRCEFCDSLAVEPRPSGTAGQPTSWAQVGRRIGSLGHRIARFNGSSNSPDNLCWSCLWCNTWPEDRRPGATDHGAVL